eukprot:TRINITY_DN5293_c0_g2_i1.p1 TRINITY_DN5293_c0_g2~~TRINITY_DN5293_c0_g2_i1.p1  ORF type:complete len:367 (+),score=94.25 TRINITY_DN5293_c0_g2_i1:70-1101(+)
MRAVLGLTFMVAGAAASGCGNCDFVIREYNDAGVAYDRIGCNTGGSSETVPYPVWSNMTGASSNASLTFNGTSTAQVARIAEIKSAVGANAWSLSFCGSYLDRYTDGAGSLRGEGAACVRAYADGTPAVVAAAFTAADAEAKALYHMFGTTNGYASSFAISNGGVGSLATKWGTGRNGDVPANWCGVYMKELFCQIAFPQIAVDKTTLDTLVTDGRTSGVPYTAQSVYNATSKGYDHYIRWVEQTSCEKLFDICNRREPFSDETKDSYKPAILDNNRGKAFLTSQTKKLESDAFCKMWRDGFGLAQAGTALGADSADAASWESGHMTVVSPLLLIAALIAVVF